jgi:hypothetical protein
MSAHNYVKKKPKKPAPKASGVKGAPASAGRHTGGKDDKGEKDLPIMTDDDINRRLGSYVYPYHADCAVLFSPPT